MTDREKPVGTKEVAEFLGVAPSTVEDWRQKGKGPTFMRIGNRCLYMMSDVHDWLTDQRQVPATEVKAMEELAAQRELDKRHDAAKARLEEAETEEARLEEAASPPQNTMKGWEW